MVARTQHEQVGGTPLDVVLVDVAVAVQKTHLLPLLDSKTAKKMQSSSTSRFGDRGTEAPFFSPVLDLGPSRFPTRVPIT